jgi:hypothetical protein
MSWRRMKALGTVIVAFLVFRGNDQGQTLVGTAYIAGRPIMALLWWLLLAKLYRFSSQD